MGSGVLRVSLAEGEPRRRLATATGITRPGKQFPRSDDYLSDRALYEAKHLGRNRVVTATESTGTRLA